MRHVLSVERDNGTFPEVGTFNRWIVCNASRARAVQIATTASAQYRRRIRVESYADHEFYKPDVTPLTTFVGKSVRETHA